MTLYRDQAVLTKLADGPVNVRYAEPKQVAHCFLSKRKRERGFICLTDNLEPCLKFEEEMSNPFESRPAS